MDCSKTILFFGLASAALFPVAGFAHMERLSTARQEKELAELSAQIKEGIQAGPMREHLVRAQNKAQKDRVRPHSLDYLTAEEYIKDGERYADAMPYLLRAADAGEAIAQYMLAECYIEGYSVDKDYTTGIRWARLAADQDYASAQAILGNCYRHGYGVRRDYTLAVYWYMLAADQGSRSALVNLGYCYEKGLGVEIDYEIAEAYYRMAKAVGQKSAEKRLSDLRAKMG